MIVAGGYITFGQENLPQQALHLRSNTGSLNVIRLGTAGLAVLPLH